MEPAAQRSTAQHSTAQHSSAAMAQYKAAHHGKSKQPYQQTAEARFPTLLLGLV